MNKTVCFLKSFGIDSSGGNSAGVVLDADTLSVEQKKAIAKEVNFSETAFVESSQKADFKLSFFTPTDEVDMCGHATIAVYSLLFGKGLIKPGTYTQEINAGILGIEITENGQIFMEQNLPRFQQFIDEKDIRDVFGHDITRSSFRPQIISTGQEDIMVYVPNREILFALSPNLEKMAAVNKKTHSMGFHVFTLDTVDSHAVAHSRNFCPLYGINEESATGSSTGALACYLYYYGKITNTQHMKFEQGYSMENPCEIFVNLDIEKQNITHVSVGGKARIIGEKDIMLS